MSKSVLSYLFHQVGGPTLHGKSIVFKQKAYFVEYARRVCVCVFSQRRHRMRN
jgi:hypothetical protein